MPGSNGQWLLGQFVQRSGNLAANPVSSRAAEELNYFHQDVQGSTVAVSDASGQIVERMAYDPWGDRRSVTGPADPNNLITAEKTDRGYTQHEMLDEVGLVHMNGRIYDPTLGRMLTADILVSYPERSTSFNRYAYALNNPLRFVDPTGWDVEDSVPNNPSGVNFGGDIAPVDYGIQSSSGSPTLANTGQAKSLSTVLEKTGQASLQFASFALDQADNFMQGGQGKVWTKAFDDGRYGDAALAFGTAMGFSGVNLWTGGTAGAEVKVVNGVVKAVEKKVAITAEEKLAADLAKIPTPNPGAVGIGRHPLADFVDYSIKAGGEIFGKLGPLTQKLWNDVPKHLQSGCHTSCAEPRIVSQVEKMFKPNTLAELKQYAKDMYVGVKNSNKGEVPACSSCKWAMDQIGMKDIFKRYKE